MSCKIYNTKSIQIRISEFSAVDTKNGISCCGLHRVSKNLIFGCSETHRNIALFAKTVEKYIGVCYVRLVDDSKTNVTSLLQIRIRKT